MRCANSYVPKVILFFNNDFDLVFFRDEGRNAVANAERETVLPGLDIVIDYRIEVSEVGLLSGNHNLVVVKTIAEIVAQKILRLDAHFEFRMVEINGLTIRIVNGKVDLDGVAMMENWRFGSSSVCDLKRCHQAVGRLEMLCHKPKTINTIDLMDG